MDDRLGHLAATYSQLEERLELLVRELKQARHDLEVARIEAAHWKAQADSAELAWFRNAHEVAAEQRDRAAEIVEAHNRAVWPDEIASEIRAGPLVIEKDDLPGGMSRFDLQDVPPAGGGLT